MTIPEQFPELNAIQLKMLKRMLLDAVGEEEHQAIDLLFGD